nr:hypothetical protein [Acidimicrobiia bacterium]
ADLPDDPAFAEVKATAVAALERASQWQEEYLAALTNEDEAAATVLVNEIDEIQAGLASVMLDALIAFRTEADLAIVELAGEFDEYLAELAS